MVRRFTDWSPIRQTLELLCKVQFAYYNDILLYVNSVYTRKQIHSAIKDNQYLMYNGKTPDITIQCRLLSNMGTGQFRIIGITAAGESLFPWLKEEDRKTYKRIKSVQNKKENKAAAARCAIAAHMMGAALRAPETFPDVRSTPVPRYYPIIIIKRDVNEQIGGGKYRFSQMRGVLETHTGKPVPMFPTVGIEGIAIDGFGENKMLERIQDLFPAYTGRLDTCLIIGDKWQSARETLRRALKKKRIKKADADNEQIKAEQALLPDSLQQYRIHEIFQHIHFATLDEEGVNVLRLFEADPTGSCITRLLVPKADSYSSALSIFEYDAKIGNSYFIQFLTGDIGKILRIRRQAEVEKIPLTVFCLPGQEAFLKDQFESALLPPEITVLDDIEGLMGDLNSVYGLGLEYFKYNY